MSNTFQKYWKTVSIVASQPLQDRRLGLIAGLVLRLSRVVILLSIWRSLFEGRETVSGMTLEAVMTYTLIAEVFSSQMSIRTALSDTLWEGIIVNRLTRPIGLYGQFVAEMVGDWVPGLLLHALPLLLLSPVLGADAMPASPTSALAFLVSLVLGIAVGSAIDVLFTAIMMFLEQSIHSLTMIRDAVSVLLSGAVLPLALFPWGIGQTLTWLPFASLASAPLRIYTNTGDPVFLMSLQMAWAVVLWPLAHGFWTYNRERLVSHGG